MIMAHLLSSEQLAAIEARARRACEYPVVDREWAVTALVLVAALRELRAADTSAAVGGTAAARPALVPSVTVEQLQAQRDAAQGRADRYQAALERIASVAVDGWLGEAHASRFYEITQTVVAALAADESELDAG
jgi:hypothetical protein